MSLVRVAGRFAMTTATTVAVVIGFVSAAWAEEARLIDVTLPDADRPAGGAALSVDGTEFVVRLDGRTLRSPELVGAEFTMDIEGEEFSLALEDVVLDGDVVLHRFVAKHAGDAVEICTPDAEGKRLGFPVPQRDRDERFELACTSGAVGKCVRWGYRPWLERRDGPPHRALHHACTRMVRADYGGDGKTYTKDGTLVYVCDRFGVRECEDDAPMTFEAAWGTDGAVCVARTRLPDVIDMDGLAKRYPRLEQGCTPEAALDDDAALVVNRSAAPRQRGRFAAIAVAAVLAVVALVALGVRRRRS